MILLLILLVTWQVAFHVSWSIDLVTSAPGRRTHPAVPDVGPPTAPVLAVWVRTVGMSAGGSLAWGDRNVLSVAGPRPCRLCAVDVRRALPARQVRYPSTFCYVLLI